MCCVETRVHVCFCVFACVYAYVFACVYVCLVCCKRDVFVVGRAERDDLDGGVVIGTGQVYM